MIFSLFGVNFPKIELSSQLALLVSSFTNKLKGSCTGCADNKEAKKSLCSTFTSSVISGIDVYIYVNQKSS